MRQITGRELPGEASALSNKRESPGVNYRTPRLGARVFRIRTRGLFTCAYIISQTQLKAGHQNNIKNSRKQMHMGYMLRPKKIQSKNSIDAEIRDESRIQRKVETAIRRITIHKSSPVQTLGDRRRALRRGSDDRTLAGGWWELGFRWGDRFIEEANWRGPSDRLLLASCHDLAGTHISKHSLGNWAARQSSYLIQGPSRVPRRPKQTTGVRLFFDLESEFRLQNKHHPRKQQPPLQSNP